MSNKKVSLLGIPFEHTTLEEMVGRLIGHVKKEEKAFVVTANPEIALAAHQDETYRDLLQQATYVTADGIGVVKAATLTGTPLPERVTGYDLFIRLLEEMDEYNGSIYLLGAKDEVLEKAVQEIEHQYPQVNIVGRHHGFFDWDDPAIEEDIKRTQPDIVFVALGFPRQEKWISEHFASFNRGVFMGIGGSFDVLAGEVKRAPKVWQTLNVEWLYRLLQQPTRWRRMLALPKFALTVLKAKVSGRL